MYPLILGFLIVLLSGFRVVKEYERSVVFRLGRFVGVRGPGIIYLLPLGIELQQKISQRVVTLDIPAQQVITKDNVSITVAAVSYAKVIDPTKAVLAVEKVWYAADQISQTTVRNIVGQFLLDQLLSDRATVNAKIKEVIDSHTEPWGIEVVAVEIKDIVLPDGMQRAMARAAEAERERQAKIVAAEGEQQASEKLAMAADVMQAHPIAYHLRTLQTLAEISIEKNSTIIFPTSIATDPSKVLETLGLAGIDKK